MSNLKQLPLSISTFKKIIEQDYLYVDKTEQIYNLIENNSYIFLSRPRRFGKSLLVSTLEELFLGNKELFKDLWIYKNTDYSWQQYPVLKFDFSILNDLSSIGLEVSLNDIIEQIAQKNSINLYNLSNQLSFIDKLRRLVLELGNNNKVVILIDEYDYPILNNLHNIELARENQKVLKNFFTTIKGLDAYIHKLFMTGITKIAKTSIFSGLNNLIDISLDSEAATLLGYTEKELDSSFKNYLQESAEKLNLPIEKLKTEIKSHYNGYNFSEDFIKVYNPFSVLNFFRSKKFDNYWFASGTPTFLIVLAKKQRDGLEDLLQVLTDQDKIELSSASLSSFEIENIPLYSALFQTGYLTIISYNQEDKYYSLSYPNQEVKESLEKYILIALINTNINIFDNTASHMSSALRNNKLEQFFYQLEVLLANIPYLNRIHTEAFYNNIVHLISRVLGFNVSAEILTNIGRIDLVVKTAKYLYVFEFKKDQNSEIAINQILDKKYYEKYLESGKEIVLVGVSFNFDKINNNGLEIKWQKLEFFL